MKEPSEEILKALDEIVDVNLEEVGRRRVGKRSSILKQPRLDDDQTEDFQKRKSLTSKRRVSFADKFQVMELCTGNVYDVPGGNISASDSALSGDSKSVPEPEISKKDAVDFAISKNEIKASSITEVVLTKSENKSLSFAKKHKISFDKNSEPESKKINIEETNTSPLNLEDSIFKHQEKLMSECKNFLFGSTDVIDEVKDQNLKSTSVDNVITKISSTYDALQQKDVEEKLCDLTCSKILSPNKSNSLPIPESVTCKSASISKHMVNDYDLKNKLNFENKNSYVLENQIGPKRWASRVEVLPISLSDMPLEENKENIFVDVKNKNVLVTNVRDLKLKEKFPLKLSQVSKHLGSQIEKANSFSVNKVLQSKKNFPPKSVKDITNKQNEKSLENKTCILNPSMELTCFPSYMDVTTKLEHLINDDYIKNDEHQLNKTCMNTSDFMDLTCKTSFDQDVNDLVLLDPGKEDLNSVQDNEKTRFMCDEMELTCYDKNISYEDEVFDAPMHCVSNISEKDNQASIDKLIEEDYDMNGKSLVSNKTQHFSSDYMELTSRTCSEETNLNSNINRVIKSNEDSGFCLQKTKYFSSYGMDLTCDLQNENDSLIDVGLNSPSDQTHNNESIHNVDIRSHSNVANANNCIGNQSYESNKSEKEPRSIGNSLTNINLATVVVDKKSDSNCDSPSKSHSSCSKQDIKSVRTDFHAQNLDILPMSNSIESLKSFKRDNISDKDREFEPDNKVAKLSNFIEPGIVYAIKQVKGVNQASPNDYNIFKFPEVFFPLKKTLKPKTSFSCSKIQLTKAVREAIRKSCSFSYAPKDWSPEFSERDTTFKNKLSKTPIKINEKFTTESVKSSKFPDIQCTPQMLGTWSRTKTIKETVHVYPDIVITENTPLPKTNISINKDGSFSISNISPDTMNCLRKSLDFNDEINSPRIIISHVREESIIENTAVVTTAADDSFPDCSKFCLDSSISLVPNDDTFSSMSLKLNSEAVNELGSTNCLNPSFDRLKAISLRDVDALNSPKDDIQTLTPTNSVIKECVIQEKVTENDITQSALTQHYENNQDCLPHRNSIALLKQKKMNQFLEFSKDVPNEEIENSNGECNRKSSYLLSSKKDRNNYSHVLKENQKTPKLKKFVMTQIEEPQESSKKHEQTPNKVLDQTSDKGSNQILNKGSDETVNKGSDQTSNKGLDQTPNKGSNQILNKGSDQILKTGSDQTLNKGSDQTLNKGSDQTLNKGLEQTLNKGAAQSSSADSRKQIITSTISSKSPTKLNKNEEISINSNENCSNMTAEINIIDKKSTINDVNVEDAATLQGNLKQNNRCPENPFERIHSLRKKIVQASESEDSLWCLKEMDEKQAVFEILGDSLFACYLICVDLEFTSDIAFCTQIAFMHLKEEPDDIDELGFSLFQSLVANDIKIVPFPANELLNKLPKLVDFALSAKCLIKDVWFIAIKNEISIEISSKIPKLNIKILNENHFSYFNVSLPISLTTYPDEKIIPEVTHIEHNVIRNEIIIDAIKKVHPGKKYLFRISEAANTI